MAAMPVATLPVALDAMGGDRAPRETVAGAVAAVRDHGIPVLLVGRVGELEPLVRALGGPLPGLALLDAPETVAMEEHAVAAVRRKRRASIVVACQEVREGRAAAVVSAGNSGAVVAAAIFVLGRRSGIERPGIAIPFPTSDGTPCYLIDAGAVVDPRPPVLLGYAELVTDYLRQVRGLARPRIGLLNNGEEPGKGNALARESFALLSAAQDVNFIGNVEANVLALGAADAVVTDGFSGNVALKSAEGAAALFQSVLRRELTRSWHDKLVAALLRPAFRRVARSLDYREYGGAPLLGVRGTVIIAHGRSDAHAITRAIVAAQRSVVPIEVTGSKKEPVDDVPPAPS
ncbi:MAG TPA: phosphate acyltransferase PlsX [Thermomicrobiaceae bacterium]|nr:phosphate acyltransferase PlsX [Thermomicrobiaceae bacterium]